MNDDNRNNDNNNNNEIWKWKIEVANKWNEIEKK